MKTKPPFTETPSGPGRIETYTIVHGKAGPEMGIVMGRLDEGNVRFLALTPGEPASLAEFQARDQIGRRGTASTSGGLNRFVPG